MTTLQIFDPPMCCSTGVCGPSVDKTLVNFAADIELLKEKGIIVDRHNLSRNPGEFAKNAFVKKALEENGNECLPLLLVDGTIVSKGHYASHDELFSYFGIKNGSQNNLCTPEKMEQKTSSCCGSRKKSC